MHFNYPYIGHKDIQVVRLRSKKNDLKNQAHFFFDFIWKKGLLPRNELYSHMAEWLQLPEPKVHMSNADEKTLVNIIKRCIQILNDNRRLDLDFGAKIITPYLELRKNGIKIND